MVVVIVTYVVGDEVVLESVVGVVKDCVGVVLEGVQVVVVDSDVLSRRLE